MITQFPDGLKQWVQNNNFDYHIDTMQGSLGNIWSSFNIDLNQNNKRKGRISTTRTILTTQGSAVVSTPFSDVPVAFAVGTYNGTSNSIFAVAGTNVYVNTSGLPNGAFVVDSAATTPSTCSSNTSDLIIYNSYPTVTTVNAAWYYDTGTNTWTKIGNNLSGTYPHHMTSFNGRLYVTDANYKVLSTDAVGNAFATFGQYTISLGSSTSPTFNITFIRAAANRIWIGTVDTQGGKGYIYTWDGASSQATSSYRLQSHGALACVIKDDIPYVMDTEGRLLVWNAGTFVEVARLPISNTLLWNAYRGSANESLRFTNSNSMSVVNGKINVLIVNNNNDNSTQTSSTIEENLPSGIWEYDTTLGLHHKFSLSYTPRGTTTVTDYGQNRLLKAGALAENVVTNTDSTRNGYLLAGAGYYTDASSTDYGIWTNDTLNTTQKSGYFITTKVEASGVTENWLKAYGVFKKFLNSNDKIVLKYRTAEADPTNISITWTSTTTFTTTSNLFTLGYAVGDEVEVTQGTGAGLCSHITEINVNGGTFTVTVDETYTGVTNGTALARLQKWIKIPSTATGQTQQFKEFPIGVATTWIQLKCCMTFTGKDELQRLILVSGPEIAAK